MTEPSPIKECPACAGCGRIANDDDRTPWKYWAELPAQSAIAVFAGLVRPLTCDRCNGSGVFSPRRTVELPTVSLSQVVANEFDRLMQAIKDRYGKTAFLIIRSESEVYIVKDTQQDWHKRHWHGSLPELCNEFLSAKAGD